MNGGLRIEGPRRPLGALEGSVAPGPRQDWEALEVGDAGSTVAMARGGDSDRTGDADGTGVAAGLEALIGLSPLPPRRPGLPPSGRRGLGSVHRGPGGPDQGEKRPRRLRLQPGSRPPARPAPAGEAHLTAAPVRRKRWIALSAAVSAASARELNIADVPEASPCPAAAPPTPPPPPPAGGLPRLPRRRNPRPQSQLFGGNEAEGQAPREDRKWRPPESNSPRTTSLFFLSPLATGAEDCC